MDFNIGHNELGDQGALAIANAINENQVILYIAFFTH